ncbi:uncharacterized protein A1O5_12984 [Cladophialophora psammophila CBS 110553]|uniref:Alpha-taxilin n=1 Tax=Cladophialophora psammophila CBS 110553 TaxID=1182543 RepID=W9VL23_9EURO|nr:uncharacterized protein A1O5_12984 [Cladophialophora psammophila CBS 110553]EXJ53735.1 hypothetical protein A1O5_12984 [Cladophialophora psammophila CBS 110553]
MATAAQSPTSQTTNGDTHDLPAPAPTAKKGKGKKDKQLSAEENAKLVQARLSQLEQEKAGDKAQQAEIDREVKKAIRDLNELINGVEPLKGIDLVKQKYEELLAEMKKTEREHLRAKKSRDQYQKEAEKSKSEHNKTTTMKDKLEKLCRELTKDNKKLKDDNKNLVEKEKRARESINERLDQMLYDVQEAMNSKTSAHPENLHLELDELFRTRCKVLADQAEIREMHFKSILRHKDAEIAHLQAKHEVERRRADTEAARCRTLTGQVGTFSHTEAELRSQLNIYVEKFKQVEDTLNNSNELFLTFRKEMEEMSKKTKRLEKENLTLTRKHDQTNRNILEMAEERTRDKEDLERLRKQEQRMRNIIKIMQEQGRGRPVQQEAVDEEGTESEYDEEFEDEDEDDEASYEAEEELATEIAKPVFGPVPPPEMVAAKANGQKTATAALVNGIQH